jgi:hypothetical protein
MDSEDKSQPRVPKQRDAKHKQALDALIDAKKRGVSRVNQYEVRYKLRIF